VVGRKIRLHRVYDLLLEHAGKIQLRYYFYQFAIKRELSKKSPWLHQTRRDRSKFNPLLVVES
jgi:hypothetical protein